MKTRQSKSFVNITRLATASMKLIATMSTLINLSICNLQGPCLQKTTPKNM